MKITRNTQKVLNNFYKSQDAFPKAFLRNWCEERNIPVDVIFVRCNSKAVIKIRNEALFAFRQKYPRMSYPMIARIFKRDHTTIMSALGVLSRGKTRTVSKQLELPL